MQSVTFLFELSVAGMLISTGTYLQHSGMPGGALALTGLLLGLATVLSRFPVIRSATRVRHTPLNRGMGR